VLADTRVVRALDLPTRAPAVPAPAQPISEMR
jgi:hypothetical protein